MRHSKIYTREQIIEAIGEKYGSIENYAKEKGTSKQNISQKSLRQSRPYMKQLQEDGILYVIDNTRLLNQSIDMTTTGEKMIVNTNEGKKLHVEEHNHYSDSGYKEAYLEAKEKADIFKQLYETAIKKIKELEELQKRSI